MNFLRNNISILLTLLILSSYLTMMSMAQSSDPYELNSVQHPLNDKDDKGKIPNTETFSQVPLNSDDFQPDQEHTHLQRQKKQKIQADGGGQFAQHHLMKRQLQSSGYYYPDYSTATVDPLITEAAGAHPCLEYKSDDPNKCIKCDQNRNYYQVLRNASHIMCGYYKPMVTTSCSLRKEHYPHDISIINLQNQYRQWGMTVFEAKFVTVNQSYSTYFCISQYIYYQTNNYDYTCANYYYLYEMPTETSLITIYAQLEKYSVCYSCDIPGYETAVIIDYPEIKYKVGACIANSNGCKYNQYYDSPARQCKSCEELFPNCAACSPNDCKMCIDGFYLNPSVYDYGKGKYISSCVFDTCPKGFCKDKNAKTCKPSTLQNCLICSDESYYYETYQTCLLCEKSMVWDQASKQCTYGPLTQSNYNYSMYGTPSPPPSPPSPPPPIPTNVPDKVLISVVVANATASKHGYFNTKNYQYYYSPYGGMGSSQDINNYINGRSITESFAFLQQAWNYHILESNPQKTAAKVIQTIYLSKGDHFFFFCSSDNMKIFQGSNSTSQTLINPCQLMLMQYGNNSTSDLTEVTIQALECSMKSDFKARDAALMIQTGETWEKAFDSLCVNLNSKIDERPTVYINDAHAFFNITGKLTVKNIKFNGINQMAVPIQSTQTFTAIPFKLCESDDPLFTKSTFKLKQTIKEVPFPFSYSCYDKFFNGVEVPPSNGTVSVSQCTANDYSQFYKKVESTLGCFGKITDSQYFFFDKELKVSIYRRRTLFNLFGFAQHLTRRTQPPELILNNCHFEYFMNNYESLINVETETYWKVSATILAPNTNADPYNYYSQSQSRFGQQNKDFYFVNGADRGAKIWIEKSIFQKSRFCKGMLAYRAGYFEPEMRALTNYTHLFMTNPQRQDQGSYIILKDSTFENLNAYTKVTSMAGYKGINPRLIITQDVINSFEIAAFIHKGIILNIEDFGGRIEVTGSTFEKNMHLIPAINYKFFKPEAYGNSESFYDMKTTQEYKLTICDSLEYVDKYFFELGYSQSDDIEKFFDSFERLSVIYISRNYDSIVFKGNVFENNIGTFGGAITINSPIWEKSSTPYIVLRDNQFYRNMAYFSGNAVYIRSTINKPKVSTQLCGGIDIQSNLFQQNVGLKIHNGGAVSLICKYNEDTNGDDYQLTSGMKITEANIELAEKTTRSIVLVTDSSKITVDKYRVFIKDNQFFENYSGMKGTGLYIKQFSSIFITDCLFVSNGPVYSTIERLYSPYILQLQTNVTALTFKDPFCDDEYKFIEECSNKENEYLYFSRVQGALHVHFCENDYCLNNAATTIQKLVLQNSQFTKNDAGPMMFDAYPDASTNPPASQLFIRGGQNNLVQNTNFNNNLGRSEWFFPSLIKSRAASKFFPEGYFQRQTSSLVVIIVKPLNGKNYVIMNTTMINSEFIGNKHAQILGIDKSNEFSGSLIRYLNLDTQPQFYLPLLVLSDLYISKNSFIGIESSLIKVTNGLLKANRCIFQNNGYLSMNFHQGRLNEAGFKSKFEFFSDFNLIFAQDKGAFHIENSQAFTFENNTHEFINNTFQYLASQSGAAVSLMINNQDANFTGNTYEYLFASNRGPVLQATSTSLRSAILMDRNSIRYIFSVNQAAIYLSPTETAQSLIIRNSTFDHIYGNITQVLYASKASKIYIENVNFTKSQYTSDKTMKISQYVMSKFNSSLDYHIEDLISSSLLEQILNYQWQSDYGLLQFEMIKNNKDTIFAGKVFQNMTNPLNQYTEIINCLFQDSISQKYSAIFLLQSNLRIFNSPNKVLSTGFQNNRALEKGIIGCEGDSSLIIENGLFKDNWAGSMASAIYSSGSSLNLTNVTFRNNSVEGLGTVTVEADTSLSCNQCVFLGNKGNDSSTIFANSNRFTQFQVNNSIFVNNTSEANLANIFQSSGSFSNVTFLNNIASKVNNGITLISSSLMMDNVSVSFTDSEYINRESYEVDTGFLNLNYRSQIQIKNTKFKNCRGALASVIYATGSSSVDIREGTVFENSYSQNGDTIYATMANSLIINGATFRSNAQIDVFVDQTPVKIYNSQFVMSKSRSIHVTSSNLEMSNNELKNSWNSNQEGVGLYCSCNNITLTNNTFKNLTSSKGGAIYLKTASSTNTLFTLYKNSFYLNTAQQGGAVFINDAIQLNIKSNSMFNNKAIVINPPSIQTSLMQSKGLGGAIYYACVNDALKNTNRKCEVNVQQNNNFQNNYAQNDGGAILWVTYPYNDDGSNQYINNTAYYGGDFGSFPNRLFVEFITNGDSVQEYKKQSNFSKSSNSQDNNNNYLRSLQSQDKQNGSSIGEIPPIAPGTPFSFNVYILDQNDQVYKTDSSSKAILKDVGSQSAETTNNRVSIYNGEVVAKEGVFKFENVIITAVPGTEINLKLEIQGMQTFGNSLDFVDKPFKFEVAVRNCTNGESLQADNSCKACPPGTYLYEAPKKETYCQECSIYAKCYGKNIVAPVKGYWRSTNVSENFMNCPNPSACLGGNISNLIGACDTGYKGILCAECSQNFKKSEQFKCTQCPDSRINTVQIFVVGIGAAIVVSLMVRSTLNSASKQKPVYSVYLKIIANHFQIVGAISNIDYNWPKAIQEFQDGQNQVSSSTDRIFSFDCFLMSQTESLKSDSGEGVPLYFYKLLIFGFLPGILALVDFIVWFSISTARGRDYSELRSKFTSTLVVLLFLVHPNIAKTMFLAFNCIDVDGQYRLKENISTVCYEGQHKFFLFIVVVPSILVWAIGIPLFALALLIRNKRVMMLMNKGTITESEHDEIMRLKMKYGFLFQGFNASAYFWEIVIMFRKIGIIMATVFFSTLSAELQVLLVLFLIVLSMFLQIRFSPYYTATLNKMENYSLQVSAVTLYSGMFYVTGRHYSYMNNENLNWFFLSCITLPNVIFMSYWAWMMRIEILKEFHRFNKPLLFKFAACMSQQAFYEAYIMEDEKEIKTQVVVKDDLKEDDFSPIDESKNMITVEGSPVHQKTPPSGKQVDEVIQLDDIKFEQQKTKVSVTKEKSKRRKRTKVFEEMLTQQDGPTLGFTSPGSREEHKYNEDLGQMPTEVNQTTYFKEGDESSFTQNYLKLDLSGMKGAESRGGFTARSHHKVYPESYRDIAHQEYQVSAQSHRDIQTHIKRQRYQGQGRQGSFSIQGQGDIADNNNNNNTYHADFEQTHLTFQRAQIPSPRTVSKKAGVRAARYLLDQTNEDRLMSNESLEESSFFEQIAPITTEREMGKQQNMFEHTLGQQVMGPEIERNRTANDFELKEETKNRIRRQKRQKRKKHNDHENN